MSVVATVRTPLSAERRLALSLSCAALAVVGIGLLPFGPDRVGAARSLIGLDVLGLTLLGIALVGVAMLSWLWRTDPSWSPLGDELVVRALIVGGVAVALGWRAGTDGGRPTAEGSTVLLVVLAAAILIGALAVEPLLARATRFRVPVVANLPGVKPPPRTRNDPRPAAFGSWLACAAGLVLAAIGAPPWWWLVVAVAVAVAYGLLALEGRAKIIATRRQRREVPKAVEAYAPAFVLYTSRPDDASYQITMWLPHLRRTGLPFLVVTRAGEPAEALTELTDLPIVEARRTIDLEALLVPSLRAAFYPNASSGNGSFVRYHQLTHVYLGHGDSDKPPSYNPTHAMYDRIFAAGPAATRRYAAHQVKMAPEKFAIVGRPQVAGVAPAAGRIADVTAPVVLYAPTWRGHVEETLLYSLPEGERIVAALLRRGATVIFRPHPFSLDFPEDAAVVRRIQQQLAGDAARTGRAHVWGAAAETERSIIDVLNASDAMVCDVSSVASDYLFSGKPFAMVAVPSEPEVFVADFPLARAAYVIRGDLADLDDAVAKMLGPDPLEGERRAVRADYLGDLPTKGYEDVFVRAVRDVVAGRAPSIAPHSAGAAAAGPDGDIGDDDTGTAAGAGESTEESSSAGAGGGEGDESGESGGDGITHVGGSRWRNYARVFGADALNLSSTVLAASALAAALLAAPPVLFVVAVCAAVGTGLFAGARLLRRADSRTRLLTQAQITRAVTLVALAAAALERNLTGLAGLGVWIGLTLLAVVLAAEAHIRTAWGALGLEATGLTAAGVDTGPDNAAHGSRVLADTRAETRAIAPRHAVTLVGFAAIAVGSVLLALPYPNLTVGLLGLIVAILGADAVVRALVRARVVVAAEAGLRAAVQAYAPQFAVYFASTAGAQYQVGMWVPYFLRIGRPFVVVTRTVATMGEISDAFRAAGADVPVIYRPTLRSLEEVVVPSLTTAFYVNNAVRNTHFVERRALTHVWLNHGDSEKPACYNPVHAIYDLIFVAGQAGIDRYARHGVVIPREKFEIVGRPQVEAIEAARAPIAALTASGASPTVLYAPTWQGGFVDSRVHSLPLGVDIVRALLARGVTVVFRPHPFNRRTPASLSQVTAVEAVLSADRQASGRPHRWGELTEQQMSVEDCFNASDAMIADISAVVSDYLRSDKPFAIVAVGRTPAELVAQAPAARAGYVLREDLSNIEDVLDELLGSDSLAAVRAETRTYYLGSDREGYAERFLGIARAVIDRRHPAVLGADGLGVSPPPER